MTEVMRKFKALEKEHLDKRITVDEFKNTCSFSMAVHNLLLKTLESHDLNEIYDGLLICDLQNDTIKRLLYAKDVYYDEHIKCVNSALDKELNL